MALISKRGVSRNGRRLWRAARFLPTLFALLMLSWACRHKSLGLRQEGSPGEPNWSIYGGEPRRINYRESTVSPPFKHLWTFKATSAIGPTLVAVDGLVCFATLDGRLNVLNIATGEKVMKVKSEDGYAATCAYYGGSLIVASRYGEKTLGRYDLESRKYIWKIDAGDIESEPLVTDGSIYVSALYNHVDKYDFETGRKRWSFKADDQLRSSPALSNGTVVVGCDNGMVYALDSAEGLLNWNFETGASVFATPIIWRDRVYVGSADSVFYALNIHTGALVWRFYAGRPLYQTAATNGEVVLFGASDGTFYCLDALDGSERWRFHAESVISTAPLISGELVYFGSLDKHYYCLRLEGGEEVWKFETKGRVRTSPVVWGKYLLGASEDRFVYAFAHSDSLSTF